MPAFRFLALGLLLAVLSCADGRLPAQNAQQPARDAVLQLGRPDIFGHGVSANDLRGHVVLVNFWATWCAPCLAEMPVLSAWQRDDGARGLRVVGVSMDDDATPVRSTVHRLRLAYPVEMADANLAQAFGGVLGLPVTVLLDRHGEVRRRYEGALDPGQVHRDILRLL